jgi:repressor LexA
MKKELTPRQQEIYEFIRAEIMHKGYPPTYREIGEHFGIRSTNGVKRTLDALRKKGYLERKPMISRGLELREAVSGFGGKQEFDPDVVKEIPIIGRVAAGDPIIAEENFEGSINVDGIMFRGEGHFALRVKGDSMKNAGIYDGDIVIARHQATAEKGEIVVAILGDEATVKRYMPQNGEILLMPENEDHDPIVVSRDGVDFRIAGKVTGLVRKY